MAQAVVRGDGEPDEKLRIFIAVKRKHDTKDLADVDERSSRRVTNVPTPSQRRAPLFVRRIGSHDPHRQVIAIA